jgi:hypothetical protein
MRTNAGWSDMAIRDVSPHGLGLRSSKAPARGDYVEICRLQHRMVARVVWSDGECFGVVLSDAISVDELLSRKPSPRRSLEDRRMERRRPGALRQVKDAGFAIVRTAENSNHAARIMNFVPIVVAACLGAAVAANAASTALSQAMDSVSAGLISARSPD